MGKKYLQLTYLGKDAYQDDDEVILLNKRCLSYQEIAELDTLGFRCLDYPSELTDMDKLSVVWDDFYHRICDELSRILSEYHGIVHNDKYWEYFLSFDFIPVILLYYERYISIKNALDLHPGIWVKVYKRDVYYLATHSIWDSENMDQLVQVIDEQIFRYLQYSHVEYIPRTDAVNKSEQRQKVKKTIKKRIRKIFNSAYRIVSRKDEFYITYSFTSKINNLRLKTIGKAYFAESELPRIDDMCGIDEEARNNIGNKIKLQGNTDFEQIFINNLSNNLNKLYIENYKALLHSNRMYYTVKPKYFVKNGYSPAVMEYAASVHEYGGVVINCAHCVEESFRFFRSKTDDLSDFTFQWSSNKLFAKNNSLECISGMLSNIKNVDYMNNQTILYVFTCEQGKHDRSLLSFLLRKRVEEHDIVKKVRELYVSLKPEHQTDFCFRNRDEWNWGVEDYLHSIDTAITIDDSFNKEGGIGFAERISSARVVITETIHSSVFFQSILYGVPTFVVDNVDYSGLLSAGFLELVNQLREVNVIVPDGKIMAQIINDHYHEIDEWWNQKHRQSVINQVLDMVWCKNTKNSVYEWWNEKMKEIRIEARKRDENIERRDVC